MTSEDSHGRFLRSTWWLHGRRVRRTRLVRRRWVLRRNPCASASTNWSTRLRVFGGLGVRGPMWRSVLQAEALVTHVFVAADREDREADSRFVLDVWRACG